MKDDWHNFLSRDLFHEFQGRCVIIAGGASGIGACLVDALHWLGAKVCILDISSDTAHDLANHLRERNRNNTKFVTYPVEVFAGDLADEAIRTQLLAEIFDKIGPVYSFISTISLDQRFNLNDLTQEQMKRLYEVNFMAPFFAAKQTIQSMRQGGGGTICLFTSSHADELCHDDMAGYGSAKRALDGSVKRLTKYVGETNTPSNIIRVFGFCPGWVLTENQRVRFEAEFKEAAKLQSVPVGMMPYELVFPVIAGLSKLSGYLTGTIIKHDGGFGLT